MVQAPSLTATKTTPSKNTPAPIAHRRLRTLLAALLGTLAVSLILSSIMAIWLNRTLTNTTTYVNTVAPLASSPDVQNFVIQKATDAIIDNVDTQELAKQLLGNQAQAVPITPAQLKLLVRPLVLQNVAQVVQSAQFATLWRSSNLEAHQQLINQIKTNASELTFNLHPVVVGVVAELHSTKLSALADQIQVKPDTGIVHIKNAHLHQARDYYQRLRQSMIVAVLLAVVAVAGAITLSVNHSKTMRRILVGTGIFAMLLAVLMQVPAMLHFNGQDAVTQRAAMAIVRTLLHNLQIACWVIGVSCIAGAIVSKVWSMHSNSR